MKLFRLLPMLLAGLAAAAPPPPTFRLPCDGNLVPSVAAPDTVASVQGPVSYVDGRVGRALVVPVGSTVSFRAAGHLSPAAGTVALWVKLDLSAGRPRFPRLFECAGGTVALRLLHLAQAEVPLYGEAVVGAVNQLPWPMGDARAIGESWQHVALAWGGGQVTLYVNGVTLCAAPLAQSLPPLPERFYVGSEPSGEQSAATAIDDVALFDRALDSHELFALAGRTPGTDWSQPNWLANSSFEVGPQPWQTFLWGEGDSRIEPAAGPCISGRHSLVVDRSLATGTGWSTAWVMGPWLHLARGREVTLSAWLRADVPDAEVSLQIQTGDEDRAVKGTPVGGVVSTNLRVDQRWRRYHLTCTLPTAYRDGYRARLCVTSHPCRVWLDDIQMAAGPMREYQPRTAVEIGLSSATGSATAESGDWLEPLLLAYAPLGTAKLMTVNWGYRKPSPRNGFVAAEAAYFLLRPGQPQQVRLRPWRLDTCGVWTVEAAHYGRADTHLAVAVTPYRRLYAPPRGSPFGTHGGDTMRLVRYGLTQKRDVSGFLWKWLERSDGQWSDDGRFAAASADQTAGLELTGTLGDAPTWAAAGDGVPRDTARWTEYVRRTVAENAGRVSLWELWNEPDLNTTLSADPSRYVELLRAAYAAQRQADPDARMIGPCPSSLAPSSFAFAERVFALGGLAALDQISWHPYSHDLPEGPFLDGLRRINGLLAEHGVTRPLVLTEYGTGGVSDPSLHIPWAADDNRRYDPDEQAAMLVRQSVLALWQGATRLNWYQWDEERLQTGPDTFGLVRADTYHSPKPALLALSQAARLLAGAELPPQQLRPRPGAWAFRFTTPTGNVACYWDPNGPNAPTWTTAAVVYDLYGNVVPRGQWRLRPEPQWVVWSSNSAGPAYGQ
ncbi:MAG: LamG domain-containing protein [Armatimonadetes bacterium]|nr:LamG domain-containing protein [Armatimonadota bacterium]